MILFVVLASIHIGDRLVPNETLRVFGAFGTFSTFIKIFDWLRLFDGTAFYIRLIIETFIDITAFLLILVITLLTFGIPMHLLNLNRSEELDNTIIDEVSPFWGLNVLLNQYFLALGEFNFDNFADNPQTAVCFFFFLMSTFLTQLTMLNMLIAIMGDTYGRIMECKEINATMTKLELMADTIHDIPTTTASRDRQRFLFVVTPDDDEAGAEGEWGGVIAKMNRTVRTEVG